MDEAYFKMMRDNLKLAGMSDEQIEATIQMQKAAMGAVNIDPAVIAAANAQAAALNQELPEIARNMTADHAWNNMFGGQEEEEEDFNYVPNPSINESYQWAIACGADLAALRGDILNDLNTDADTSYAPDVLENDWGIESHDDAVEMCDSLLAGRHSTEYNAAAQTGTGKHGVNIRAAMALFMKDGMINAASVPNMLIWDLGRLVTVCRLAFDAGFLSRDETMQYLRELAPKVQATYKSWREMSVAYQFGRAVWGGVDEDEYNAMKGNMEFLLKSAESPWNKLPFDMKLAF